MKWILSLFFGFIFRASLAIFILLLISPVIDDFQKKNEIENNLTRAIKRYHRISPINGNDLKDLCLLLYNTEKNYKINYKKILAIWMHESRMHPKAYNVNKNGTVDFGLGQLNSGSMHWFFQMSKDYSKIFENISYKMPKYFSNGKLSDPVFNASLSITYIIYQHNRFGHKNVQSIVSYNAGSPYPLYVWYDGRRYPTFAKKYVDSIYSKIKFLEEI